MDTAQAAFETHCSDIRLQGKKTTSYQEQDRQKVAAYREEIQDIIALEKIAYVDESGIGTYLYREYRYASPKSGCFLLPQIPGTDFSFFHPTPQNSILLNVSVPG